MKLAIRFTHSPDKTPDRTFGPFDSVEVNEGFIRGMKDNGEVVLYTEFFPAITHNQGFYRLSPAGWEIDGVDAFFTRATIIPYTEEIK